ncbi:hypothetical protein GGS23DRAFT_143743 [Durotheca rogersii]|uniref:uncharacterized protein n=1 Tax=Durotheca rogersii TaxID=419775 RepID=UPI00221FA650|nr:uncharacterized protein GGS23DRAFT_143743 [Durotheca rogersii]KAI5861649.1 hypothetical protein GGS23DRAFT_143743 [Durotheca rogersii]
MGPGAPASQPLKEKGRAGDLCWVGPASGWLAGREKNPGIGARIVKIARPVGILLREYDIARTAVRGYLPVCLPDLPPAYTPETSGDRCIICTAGQVKNLKANPQPASVRFHATPSRSSHGPFHPRRHPRRLHVRNPSCPHSAPVNLGLAGGREERNEGRRRIVVSNKKIIRIKLAMMVGLAMCRFHKRKKKKEKYRYLRKDTNDNLNRKIPLISRSGRELGSQRRVPLTDGSTGDSAGMKPSRELGTEWGGLSLFLSVSASKQ